MWYYGDVARGRGESASASRPLMRVTSVMMFSNCVTMQIVKTHTRVFAHLIGNRWGGQHHWFVLLSFTTASVFLDRRYIVGYWVDLYTRANAGVLCDLDMAHKYWIRRSQSLLRSQRSLRGGSFLLPPSSTVLVLSLLPPNWSLMGLNDVYCTSSERQCAKSPKSSHDQV